MFPFDLEIPSEFQGQVAIFEYSMIPEMALIAILQKEMYVRCCQR